ncbi:hypothetical protein N9J72_01500 [Candidatus Gracilibacteria bacterium]|nr:hypothetical protein [Candidatus Gracilibacteria bacterium]
MRRKLYALLILIGVIGAGVLTYLYFFVYYTATLTVNSNVPEYSVELFSKSTAQKRVVDCPEEICIINEVSPFEYNVSILKDDYESQNLNITVKARRPESLFLELEKKVSLSQISSLSIQETNQERIQRLRAENRSYARFDLGNNTLISFREEGNRLEMLFEKGGEIKLISDFLKVPENSIGADSISSSDSVFLGIGENSYIFDTTNGKLFQLDFQIDIFYIKAGSQPGEYLIITEKGAFLYNSISGESEFQYLFRDYVYSENEIIGIIFKDEEQKKQNFDLEEESENLIMKYNPQDKTRKILYRTNQAIERIVKQQEKIILTIQGEKFELENY